MTLYAVGDVTDEQLAEANAYLQARGVDGLGDEPPLRRCRDGGAADWGAWLGHSVPTPQPAVEWYWSPRYYGPGYERGYWPDIHNAIVCLRAALPHCTVHYGSDTQDAEEGAVPPVTDQLLRDLWAHWLSPDGRGYHERVAAFNASRAARG